jgi:hypothetical protein
MSSKSNMEKAKHFETSFWILCGCVLAILAFSSLSNQKSRT